MNTDTEPKPKKPLGHPVRKLLTVVALSGAAWLGAPAAETSKEQDRAKPNAAPPALLGSSSAETSKERELYGYKPAATIAEIIGDEELVPGEYVDPESVKHQEKRNRELNCGTVFEDEYCMAKVVADTNRYTPKEIFPVAHVTIPGPPGEPNTYDGRIHLNRGDFLDQK